MLEHTYSQKTAQSWTIREITPQESMSDVVLGAPVRGHRVQWLSTVPSLAAATDYEELLIPTASSGSPVSVMFTTVNSMDS
jgi:hypothetical protein